MLVDQVMKEDDLFCFVFIISNIQINPDDNLAVEHATVDLIEDVVLDVHYSADHANFIVVAL
jgi:hypothetical protein